MNKVFRAWLDWGNYGKPPMWSKLGTFVKDIFIAPASFKKSILQLVLMLLQLHLPLKSCKITWFLKRFPHLHHHFQPYFGGQSSIFPSSYHYTERMQVKGISVQSECARQKDTLIRAILSIYEQKNWKYLQNPFEMLHLMSALPHLKTLLHRSVTH